MSNKQKEQANKAKALIMTEIYRGIIEELSSKQFVMRLARRIIMAGGTKDIPSLNVRLNTEDEVRYRLANIVRMLSEPLLDVLSEGRDPRVMVNIWQGIVSDNVYSDIPVDVYMTVVDKCMDIDRSRKCYMRDGSETREVTGWGIDEKSARKSKAPIAKIANYLEKWVARKKR